MRRIASALLLLALAWPSAAQEVSLEVKGDTATVQVDRVVVVKEDRLLVRALPFSVQAPAGGFGYQWDVPPGWAVTRKGRTLEVTAAPKGEAKVSVTYSVVDFDARKVEERYGAVALVVGEVGPGPAPPDPKPPVPPDPKPPAPGPGLRVLVTFETGKTYPEKVGSVLFGKTVRDYLKARCAVDPAATDGRAYRIWDKDTDAGPAAKEWQDLMRLVQGRELQIVIARDGAVLHQGPLPATKEEALALLKKYGG